MTCYGDIIAPDDPYCFRNFTAVRVLWGLCIPLYFGICFAATKQIISTMQGDKKAWNMPHIFLQFCFLILGILETVLSLIKVASSESANLVGRDVGITLLYSIFGFSMTFTANYMDYLMFQTVLSTERTPEILQVQVSFRAFAAFRFVTTAMVPFIWMIPIAYPSTFIPVTITYFAAITLLLLITIFQSLRTWTRLGNLIIGSTQSTSSSAATSHLKELGDAFVAKGKSLRVSLFVFALIGALFAFVPVIRASATYYLPCSILLFGLQYFESLKLTQIRQAAPGAQTINAPTVPVSPTPGNSKH